MALIRVYSYDFFSWQQRYLTELANTGRRRLPATNFIGARQPLAQPSGTSQTAIPPSAEMPAEEGPPAVLLPGASPVEILPPGSPSAASPQSRAKSSSGMPSSAMGSTISPSTLPPPVIHPSEKPQSDISLVQKPRATSSLGMPFSAMGSMVPPSPLPPSDIHQSESPQPDTPSVEKPPVSMPNMSDHSMHEEVEAPADYAFIREDDILYANKAKLELLNLGVGSTQLEELARSGKYVKTIEVRSPVTGLVIDRRVSPLQKVDRGTECFRVVDLGRVWIVAEVFNPDAKYIQPGMSARISLPRQNKYVEARVSDVLPPFDAKSRTLKVRLEMENPEYVFRPEMFVDVEFLVVLPPAVTVPAAALLDSGRRKTLFIAQENGYFESREVVTGWRFGDRVEIVSGLAPGEHFVSSGTFLIDSESRMKSTAAGLMKKPDPETGASDQSKPVPSDQGKLRHD
jgi:hypothetical protein